MIYTFVDARYRLCHANISICSICSRTTLIIACIKFVIFHFIVRYSIYIIRLIMLFVDLAATTRNWFFVIIDNPLRGDMFNLECEKSIERRFISEWENEINDPNQYPSRRTYRMFKTKYEMEPYLYLVKNPKYTMAISKFRSVSHILEIERGQHTRPITPLENRLCPSCKAVETEIHFLLECPLYECYRRELSNKVPSAESYVKRHQYCSIKSP